MSDIVGGETFVDGQSVSGIRLNNHVNNAVIQAGLIGDKALGTPASEDHVLYRKNADGSLHKATIASVNAAGGNVTSVALTMPAEFGVAGSPITGAGTLAATWHDVSLNKVLASPADGSLGPPTFRRNVPADLRIPSVAIAAAAIDWSLSKTFYKSLGGAINFTFSNVLDGLKIHVAVIHNTFVAHWPATILWEGGIEPLPTLATSIFKFIVIGGVTYGWIEAVNCSVP